MQINIKNDFIFNFFPNIANKEITVDKAYSIIKFLKIYESLYKDAAFIKYNFKSIICALKYNNYWIVLDDKFNYFNINCETFVFIDKISDQNDDYNNTVTNIIMNIDL
jgi:hypothetical protein